ncbi:hypothetical protein BB560_005612 [Smittium megazygosporum]|uniref:Uncharacterized protein n=1 Tax=Smittium megazygosporum TaxID=133381 RepID=A0A2T9Z2D4_9FUNG|nr:hypothetical protein BB560_005612 [Smittium megazygosporum]
MKIYILGLSTLAALSAVNAAPSQLLQNRSVRNEPILSQFEQVRASNDVPENDDQTDDTQTPISIHDAVPFTLPGGNDTSPASYLEILYNILSNEKKKGDNVLSDQGSTIVLGILAERVPKLKIEKESDNKVRINGVQFQNVEVINSDDTSDLQQTVPAAPDTTDDASDNTADDASDDTIDDTTDDASDDTSDDTTDDASDDTSDDTTDDASDDASDDTSDDASDDASDDTSDDTSDDASDE